MLSFRSAIGAAVITMVACSNLCWAQVEENAKAVLGESAKALANLKSATFTGHRYIDSNNSQLKGMIDVQGQVKLLRGASLSHLIDGKSKIMGMEETFKAAQSGNVVTWLDEANKKVIQAQAGTREATNGTSTAQQVVPEEYLSAEPYKRPLDHAEKLVVEGSKEVNGEVCDVVHAYFKGGRGEMLVYLSQKDKLPRRIETIGGQKDDRVTMVQDVMDLNANASLTAADVTIATPEGFTMQIIPAKADPATAKTPESEAPVATPPAPPVQLGVAKGEQAPAFELQDGAGNAVSLESLKGNVVVLEFFATAMGASKKGSPEVQKIADGFKDRGVKVFGIACREKRDGEAAQYQKDLGLTYGLLLKGDEVAKAYQVKGFPSFAVIDANGKMVDFIQGVSTQGWEQRLATAVQTAADAK